MAKDYAKIKSKKSQRHNASSKKIGNNTLWLVAMVLTGIFISGLFFLKQQDTHLAHEKLVEKVAKENIDTATKPVDKAHQPRFDFYTMLPKVQVSTPENTKPVNNAPQTIPTAKQSTQTTSPSQIDSSVEKELQNEVAEQVLSEAKSKSNVHVNGKKNIKAAESSEQIPFVYFLQLGIYKTFQAADELKAQMNMLGHEAQIKIVHRNNLTLYRVVLGPYKTNEAAERHQQELQSQHIRSEIVR